MDKKPKNSLQLWIVRLAFPLFIILLIACIVIFLPQLWIFFTDPDKVRLWVQEWGIWAPAVFMCLQIIQVIGFIIPGEVLQVAGGYLFGFIKGSIYSILGITLGSCFAFVFSRILGVRFVNIVAGEKSIKKFSQLMASPKLVGGFFLLFLIPGFPKDILCYIAGLSYMKFVAFFVISTIARVPGILGSSLIGKAVAESDWMLLMLMVGLAGLLVILSWFFNKPILVLIERYAINRHGIK